MMISHLRQAAAFTGLCAGLLASTASAQTCSSYPTTLANGTTADATQVMGNFNCAALTGAAHFTGNVGIGTTTPTNELQIYANTNGYISTDVINASAGSSAESALSLYTGTPNSAVYSTLHDNAGVPYYQLYAGSGVRMAEFSFPAYNFQSAIGAPWITIATNGYIQTGVPSVTGNTFSFYVNGSAGGTQAWNQTSDARLKKDIVEITDALSLVERLRGVRYRWRPTSEREVGKDLSLPVDQPQLGFIAQEVAEVAPEAVTIPKPGSSDIYSLKESDLMPIVVQAMKEQQTQIKAEQAEITAQHAEIEALRAALNAVKSAH